MGGMAGFPPGSAGGLEYAYQHLYPPKILVAPNQLLSLCAAVLIPLRPTTHHRRQARADIATPATLFGYAASF